MRRTRRKSNGTAQLIGRPGPDTGYRMYVRACIIGASLSEPAPHRREVHARFLDPIYIYMVRPSLARAALYKTYRPHEILSDDKSAPRKINCGPRGRSYVITIKHMKQASATEQIVVVMLSKEQTVIFE